MDRDEERGRGLGLDEPFFLILSRSSISIEVFQMAQKLVLYNAEQFSKNYLEFEDYTDPAHPLYILESVVFANLGTKTLIR